MEHDDGRVLAAPILDAADAAIGVRNGTGLLRRLTVRPARRQKVALPASGRAPRPRLAGRRLLRGTPAGPHGDNVRCRAGRTARPTNGLNVLASVRDEHVRNHGFLMDSAGTRPPARAGGARRTAGRSPPHSSRRPRAGDQRHASGSKIDRGGRRPRRCRSRMRLEAPPPSATGVPRDLACRAEPDSRHSPSRSSSRLRSSSPAPEIT